MAMVPAGSGRRDAEAELNLPPGFRFHPTDEELVVHYLCRKVARQPLPVSIIAEVDLYKLDPWDLPEKALFGRKEWYFFTPRDRKYPNGSRPNRAAGGGYWKATGADKPIAPKGSDKPAGIKKALVFYNGKAPRGAKTDWIMHEYRLAEGDRGKKGSQKLDEWVLCRLYNKKNNWEKVKVEESQVHHRQNGEVMDTLADTMSDSFQTHDSEADNASGMHNSFADMAHGQQPAVPNNGMVAVKQDNDWYADINFDDLQSSYMNQLGHLVNNPNQGQMVNPAAGQDHASYLQSISAPQMRMWQAILPPF